jgi:hypothetical protein
VQVADRGNKRIQVGNAGNFNMQSTNIGAPSAISIGAGAHRYLFNIVNTGREPEHGDRYGEIHKMEL